MSGPYIGEIRLFGGNFAPAGWAFCDGSVLPISENDALFSLLGTTYGGDGQSTFALPDLRSRVPMHVGAGHQLGEMGGVEQVTLTTNQIPVHNHNVPATSTTASTADPVGAVPARLGSGVGYGIGTQVDVDLKPFGPAGGSQPHENLQPTLAVSFIIALFGIYPSPS